MGNRSAEGAAWRERYRERTCARVRSEVRRSLRALFDRDTEGGRAALESSARALERATVPDSLRRILERWYYGAHAYLEYCVGRLDRALDDLDRAERAIVAAIDCEPMLLPAAQECPDFPHQRVRVARQARRWDEMRRQILVEREMLANERPLCVLADGTEVDYARLIAYYQEGAWDDEERAYLGPFLDARVRVRAFDRSVPGLYALGGWVTTV